MPVRIGAGELGGDLGAIDRRRNEAEGLGQYADVETGEVEELQNGRIGEQALEIWRARLTAPELDKLGVPVAEGELRQAQTVTMRIEAQSLGVDRDDGASADPLGEIALVEADGHAARIFRCGADSLSQNAQGLSKRRGGLRPTRSPARRIVLTNGWALVDGPPGPGSNPMRYILALIVACAIAAPPASAASSKSTAKSVSAAKSDQATKTGKRNRQNADHSGAGGIHPLVGSGDY